MALSICSSFYLRKDNWATETGYHGVLGLIQKGKADMCFLPLPLDTQKAPGYFTSVISEQNYYISTLRNLDDNTSTVVSSLTSVTVIPFLLAILATLILELIAVEHFKIDALDYKIDTLKDVISQGKTPFFIEGLSLYDFFKAEVNKDYAAIYERSVAAVLEEPFPLGPIPVFERRDKMVTFVSGIGKKLTPLVSSVSGTIKTNQEQYFSAKPFHRSLQSMLYSYNVSKSFRTKINTLTRRIIQSGIATKIEGDIYVDFILSFYPATLYDFHKSEVRRKVIDLSWKSLNYTIK
uniref:Ionotropic glutamate receptor C-terminal domain-containing protein n=1 Tax=Tetranychus urticae TaxID=32264 RepID=T1KME0_TETUR